ncbi:MAG: mandelate racemase/muconate lactonizing enzyme family protein [Rhizobiaceae bacterium]|nr:mandelate racemase/muconate lactonizing enzyme family protein [Rhizobiaceae bacterium]MCV0407413.1 mandelate racemase/muconate lactonizing enzyme family protein [Rhizobiaceae bacterium]
MAVIDHVGCRVFRAPVETPVRTSFGLMRDRPAVLVEVRDSDGAVGWGEIWCNFPSVGAEHRARLVRETLAPLLVGRDGSDPAACFDFLDRSVSVLAIQAGEPGPLAQAIAGIDIALWDMAARKAGLPLWRLLGGEPVASVPAYASGLNPDRPERLAAARLADGHVAFKLKVGFGRETDLRNIGALRRELGEDAELMVDANQAWQPAEAREMASALADWRPRWLEEPLRADAPLAEWSALADASPVPLAAGENMRGADFDAALASGHLGVLQPDIAKWGGLTRCAPVARAALAHRVRFCPHWLGGGLGLVASAHLLAAIGGDGRLEIDSNPNPLRDEMLDFAFRIEAGAFVLPEGPGLGVLPDLASLARFEVGF